MEMQKKPVKNIKSKPKKRSWFRRLLLFLGIVFLLLAICLLLLRIPAVQNWLADKITRNLSEKTQTNIEVGHINLDIRKGFVLEDFLIEEADKDTLIYAKSLSTGLTSNLYSLFSNQLFLDHILLENAQINLERKKDETQTNLSSFLNKLGGSNTSTSNAEPMQVDLNALSLNQVSIQFNDEHNAQTLDFDLDNATIKFENISDKAQPIIISQLFLNKPVIKILKTGSNSASIMVDDQIKNPPKDSAVLQAIRIKEFQIIQGEFTFKDLNKKKTTDSDHLDYNNLNIKKVNLLINDFDFEDVTDLTFELERFAFEDDNKFIVQNISSSNVSLSDRKLEFKDFKFQTEDTKIGNYLAFNFSSLSDFSKFGKKIQFDLKLNETNLSLKDLNYFIPGLTQNDFFLKNKDKRIDISGRIINSIDQLAGRDVKLKIGDMTTFDGSFDTRNLISSRDALLNIKVEKLQTNVFALKSLVPNFNPPENFYKLGNLNFNGRFDGYLENFVAYGTLISNLGKAEMDIYLDVQDGADRANYSGDLSLENFDLGIWSDNPDLGRITLESFIEDGQGLTLDNAKANLDANVESFTYRGYEYKDFTMDGKVDKNQFVGLFRIKDPNADFLFDGEILLLDGVPQFDFVADIQNIDLKALQISNEFESITGKINVNAFGKDLESLVGQGLIQGLKFKHKQNEHNIQSLLIESSLEKENIRSLKVTSDIVNADMRGEMNFREMINEIKRVVKESYPYYFNELEIKEQSDRKDQIFVYEINILDSENFLSLAGLDQLRVVNMELRGSFDTKEKEFVVDSNIEKLINKADTLYNARVNLFNLQSVGKFITKVDSMRLGGRLFNPVKLSTNLNEQEIEFNISSSEVFDSLQVLDLSGIVIPSNTGYAIRMDDSNLEMLGSKWKFAKGNTLMIGEDYIEANRMSLIDEKGNREIVIDDINKRGLRIDLNNFDFLTVNGIIDYDKIDFSGRGDVNVEVDNIFNVQNIVARSEIPELRLNETLYGKLQLYATKQGPDYFVDIGIMGESIDLILKASVDGAANEVTGRLNATGVPFSLFGMIIPEGLSDIEGTLRTDVALFGSLDDPKMDGELRIMNGQLIIDYLGEALSTHNQPIKVTNELITFKDTEITDHLGNPAYINGVMTHDFLADFEMDVEVEGEDVILLNTEKGDNPYYYGLGRGQAHVHFTGPFSNADMVLNCTTGPETKIKIPVQNYETGYEESFIQFINKEALLNRGDDVSLDSFKLEGLDVEMNVSITPESELQIIFDEKLNDVLRGKGTGNVQLYITREGEFYTYGDYEIEQGDYLLTIFNFAGKAFQIRQGGTIRWTGDPINTNLNIKADYVLQSNLTVFLAEFLDPTISSETARAEAGRKKRVNLIMDIGGTLYNPIVNFDIEFPDIESAELKGYVESKMRSLKSNPNALNDQVAGLLTFNTFLPSTNNQRLDVYTSNSLVQLTNTTVSEFVSNQLSFLLTSLINEAIGENNVISSIDVELGLNSNNNLFNQDAALLDLFNPDEIQSYLNARFKFLDERFSIRVGGNYIRQGNFIEGSQFINDPAFVGDLAIEYDVTEDRRLKLRFYNRFDRDEVSGNPKNKSGLGLSWRKEFGSLVDFGDQLQNKLLDLEN